MNSNPLSAEEKKGYLLQSYSSKLNRPYFYFTEEHSLSLSSLTEVQWTQGNRYAADVFRVALRIDEGGGNVGWYVSASTFTNASIANHNDYAAYAEAKSLVVGSSGWKSLTFTPGVPMVVGSDTTLPSSGTITAWGLFCDSRTGYSRFDSFTLVSGGQAPTPDPPAPAAHYVATNGDDSNSGSIGSPWLTVAHGVRQLAPGDTLYLRGGPYTEWIHNTIPAGTSTARVSVCNYEDEVVTLKPNTGADRVIYFTGSSKSYITLKGLICDGENGSLHPVRFDTNEGSPHHIRFEQSTIKNGPYSGILTDGNYCEFLNLNIHDNGATDKSHGIYMTGWDNLIADCEIHHNSGFGVHNYKSGGSGNASSRNTYRNNRIHHNGLTTGEAGMIISTGSSNKVYNNLIYDNGGAGLVVNYGTPTYSGIYNNTIYGNSNGGIIVGSYAGVGNVFRNNISYDNGGDDYSVAGGITVTADHNLFGVDPEFASTDPANADFLKIQSGSPAEDAGTDTSPINTLVTEDYWGTPRPQPLGGDYDIGAHELGGDPPAAPGSLTATAVSSTQVDLSWPDVSGETLYRLERKTGAGAFGPLTTKTANTTTHSDTTVTAGTNYTYQIRAENTYGYSAWTASNSVTTPGGGETTFVTGQNLSPSQWNNYTGWKGMKLTVGASPVTVTELGRWVLSGNSGTHTVKLVDSSGAAVGSVSVATSGAPAGQFKYVALGSPVTLSASQVYYLVSQETSGGDYWWGYTTTLSHTSVATVNNAVTSSDGASFTNDGATDNCSVPLSFKYTTEAQPFVTGQNLSPSQWNNYTGWKGMKLTVGASPVTVTELGRWVLSGNSGTHTVKLVNSSGAAVGSVSVATSGAPAGQFKYVALGSPVTLSASQVYYLVSQETSGGDYWWGYTTTLSHTSVATVNNAVTSSDGASFTNDGATDNCSVPLSFKYN